MTLDPRWAIFLTLALGIGNFTVASSGLFLDAGWDPAQVKHMMAYLNYALGVLAVVASVFAGIPSKDNKTGFIIKGPPPPEPPKP